MCRAAGANHSKSGLDFMKKCWSLWDWKSNGLKLNFWQPEHLTTSVYAQPYAWVCAFKRETESIASLWCSPYFLWTFGWNCWNCWQFVGSIVFPVGFVQHTRASTLTYFVDKCYLCEFPIDCGIISKYIYRPQTKLCEFTVFTPVCDSVHSGGLYPKGVSLSRGSWFIVDLFFNL